MRQYPFRPDNKITQTYNSGVVKIYSVKDGGETGCQPVEVLDKLKETLRYEERRLGVTRLYAARQNQVRIDRVIRCPARPVTSQDVAVTEDGKKYRIDLVQAVPDAYPPSADLTLAAFDQGV